MKIVDCTRRGIVSMGLVRASTVADRAARSSAGAACGSAGSLSNSVNSRPVAARNAAAGAESGPADGPPPKGSPVFVIWNPGWDGIAAIVFAVKFLNRICVSAAAGGAVGDGDVDLAVIWSIATIPPGGFGGGTMAMAPLLTLLSSEGGPL